MSTPSAPVDDLFPPPIAISGRYLWTRYAGGIAGLVAAVAVVAAYTVWQFGELRRFQRDIELFENPAAVSATDVGVDGEVSSNLFLSSYKLKVQYTDAAGARHDAKVEFDTVPEMDRTNYPAVHYDPADPTRFALNLSVRERGKRLGAILTLMIIGALLIGGSIGGLSWAALRNALAFRRISRNGRVVLCEPVKTTEVRRYGKVMSTIYHYRVPAGPRPQPFERKQAFRAKSGGPLQARGQLVGMWSPDAPRAVLLLGANFEPLELTPEEKAQASRRLES